MLHSDVSAQRRASNISSRPRQQTPRHKSPIPTPRITTNHTSQYISPSNKPTNHNSPYKQVTNHRSPSRKNSEAGCRMNYESRLAQRLGVVKPVYEVAPKCNGVSDEHKKKSIHDKISLWEGRSSPTVSEVSSHYVR